METRARQGQLKLSPTKPEAGQPMWQFWGTVSRYRWAIVWALAAAAFGGALWWLRHVHYQADLFLYGYAEIVGSLIAFTYGANMLVRFRGTHDRVSLILAFAFVISGLLEMASGVAFHSSIATDPTGLLSVPLPWMIGRTLLAALLITALVVDRRLPSALYPGREITGAFAMVALVAYVTSAAYIHAVGEPAVDALALFPRPWQLIPAVLFLMATIGYWKRLSGRANSACDRAIVLACALNFVCQMMVSQAESLLSAPFALAQVLKVGGNAVVLGGALLDNARLFDQVRQLAVSDPLTGLANYRRFVDTLEGEIKRSQRTGRTFALLLLDLDGLKKINDQLGHLVGTRAISRVADTLRVQSRSIDTAARYGGDEFALVMPETGAGAAQRVGLRIGERLANDGEEPPLSASLGIAVFPDDGESVDALLSAADQGLYLQKGKRKKKTRAVVAPAATEARGRA